MRNMKITRIVCFLMAALLLVSSVVIVVSADETSGGSSNSMDDFLASLNTISYEEYMEYYSHLFGVGNGDATQVLAFDATTGWTFESTNGDIIEITSEGWKMTVKKTGAVYTSVEEAVAADPENIKKEDLVYLTDEYDKVPTLYTPAVGTVTWKLDLSAFGITDQNEGLYSIELTYYPVLGKSTGIEREFYLNGEVPFAEARALNLPKLWGS